jgi:hypothetical protein
MRVRRLTSVTLLVAGLAVSAGPALAEIIDRVLAMVGSQVVTLSDVRAAEAFGLLPPSAVAGSPEDVVGQLVNRHLMLGEVDRYSAPEPERPLVDRRLAAIRGAFRGAAEFSAALARTAMTEERLRSAVVDNLRIEAYVEQRLGAAAQPTLDEIQRYYREHPAEFTTAGRLAAFEDIQPLVLQKVSAERKQVLIRDWLDRLRRREGVVTR